MYKFYQTAHFSGGFNFVPDLHPKTSENSFELESGILTRYFPGQ